ncbi:MAG: hypothetical protein R2939_12755 [Kofleriaceae bacterium]
MAWEPLALALVFGLVISAGIYFAVLWPDVEPPDDEELAAEEAAAVAAAPTAATDAPAPADDAPPAAP